MRRLESMLAVLGVAVLCGCGGGTGGSAPAPAPRPGMAGLTVVVRAEPKSGWRDPRGGSSMYELGQLGAGRAFETVDYAALDEVVVWVVTEGATASSDAGAGTVMIDVGRPAAELQAYPSGAAWSINNSAPEALSAFIRDEEGSVTDVGLIAPGGQVTRVPPGYGLHEVMTDTRPEPLARIYLIPGHGPVRASQARVTRAGGKVRFDDLPPGVAIAQCWHPRLPGSSQSLVLTAGKTTNATLTVGVNQLPKVP